MRHVVARPGRGSELTRITFRVMQKIERERITMIRWNKWTRDYTYTYEWHDGVWQLIHKKSNRPIVHWVKSWYNTSCVGSRTYKKGLPV